MAFTGASAEDALHLDFDVSGQHRCTDNRNAPSTVTTGVNAIDYAGRFLANDARFLAWAMRAATHADVSTVKVVRTRPDAILPYKTHASDVGYDLTALGIHKTALDGRLLLCDTGIRLDVPPGIYAEIVPRSSLSKTGYILANSVGIIDPSYRNNLYVALLKIDAAAPDLTFPFRGVQLIFRHQLHVRFAEEASGGSSSDTARGLGGFGSTNAAPSPS